jgi:hypothetical protein
MRESACDDPQSFQSSFDQTTTSRNIARRNEEDMIEQNFTEIADADLNDVNGGRWHGRHWRAGYGPAYGVAAVPAYGGVYGARVVRGYRIGRRW